MTRIRIRRLLPLLVVPACVVVSTSLRAITIELAASGTEFVRVGDEWRFFRGKEAPSTPADEWKTVDFADSGWEVGPSGFGYDDGDDATNLDDMEEDPDAVPPQLGYLAVYIRKDFTLAAIPASGQLVLEVDFDDGCIAYLNGSEIARVNMPDGPVDHNTPASSNHEAGTPERFVLGNAGDFLQVGKNVLAVEGHNVSRGSSDFSLIPSLRAETEMPADIFHDGERWVVESETVGVSGATAAPDAVAVKVNSAAVAFDPATGAWEGEVTLSPGRNTVVVEAFDAAETVVDSGELEIVRIAAEQHITELTDNAVWSRSLGGYVVEQNITVAAGKVLTIEPGVTVYFKDSLSMVVSGTLRADGTAEDPIRFTRHGDNPTWGRLMFVEASDSRLVHCIVEYSDCEGDHKDYYDTRDENCDPVAERLPRDYHEAVVVIASHVDMEGCTFQKLPDESGNAEGDAIAVISDDVEHPGDATANIRSCQFLSIGQGVHTRYSYVLVEDCYFTDHDGDNDDVDLYGESDPPPLIQNNLFVDPSHDDMINPTRCSAIIVGNVVAGSDDHGIVLRDRSDPIVMNNLIYDCSSAGISVQNTCDALLVNNTIVDCGRGVRFFDHTGRWGLPYCLMPGGGRATLINCIIWNCPTSVSLTDDSHATLTYCDVEGGEGSVTISDDESTLTWGAGNISEHPLFVDAANRDFHLQEGSPAVDTGTEEHAPEHDFDGRPRPCGDGVDMGAYEYGSCGPDQVRFRRGDVNSDGSLDVSDGVSILLYLFRGGEEPTCKKSADADDSGSLEITDAVYLLNSLFLGGNQPPVPFALCGLDPTDDELTCLSFAPCGG